jgi:hypothetical protein
MGRNRRRNTHSTQHTYRAARRQPVCDGPRTFVFVDIENVMGGEDSPRRLEEAIDLVAAVAVGRPLLTIGMSHHWCAQVGVELRDNFPGCRIPDLRSGPDGADLTLIAAMREQRIATGDSVVLLSGDGLFAEVVGDLVAAGVEVTVVTGHGGMSRALGAAASVHVRGDQLLVAPVGGESFAVAA